VHNPQNEVTVKIVHSKYCSILMPLKRGLKKLYFERNVVLVYSSQSRVNPDILNFEAELLAFLLHIVKVLLFT
jgi:hypothetical protein